MLDEIATIPLICAQYAADRRRPDEELSGRLDEFLELRSKNAALFLASTGFQQAVGFPGYLVKSQNGRNYYAPFNLASMLPKGTLLDEMDSLLVACRLGESGNVCLSGSATFLDRIVSVTDLDFCEYYFDDLETARSLVEHKTQGEGLPSIFRIKSGADQVEHRPFQNLGVFLAGMKLHPGSQTEFEHVKLDYIAAPKGFGPIAITNLVLSTDIGSPTQLNSSLSFQHQEIVVCERNRQPYRSLACVEDLGRYMNWLKDQFKALIEESATERAKLLKALKRALSWFLIVGLEKPVEAIVYVLGHSVMAKISSSARTAELERMLGSLDATTAQELRRRVGIKEAVNAVEVKELQNFYVVVRELALDLEQQMDSLSGA
jgi:hypothetical protein